MLMFGKTIEQKRETKVKMAQIKVPKRQTVAYMSNRNIIIITPKSYKIASQIVRSIQIK